MTCSLCKENKPLKTHKNRKYSWCNECYTLKRRQYSCKHSIKNKEKIKESNDIYRKNNRKKCLESSSKCNLTLKKQMIEAYGGDCQCCGEKRIEFLTL